MFSDLLTKQYRIPGESRDPSVNELTLG